MKTSNWEDRPLCPNCGNEFEASDILPFTMIHDGEHEDNILCDNCGTHFDCYLSVTYEFKTIENKDKK